MRSIRNLRPLFVGAVALVVGLVAAATIGAELVEDVFALDDGEHEFEAVVEAMPPAGVVGTWQIGGRTVQVTEATEVEQDGGPIAVGSRVEVEGALQADGSIDAAELEAEEADDDDDDD